MLQIRLLGQFDVRLDGKRIVISSRAGQSLLAYLAMTAGTPHRREKLAGTLWPESSDDNARKNLRQELWRIRKAIPTQSLSAKSDYLLSDEYTITFNRDADFWLDVGVLERPDLDPQSLTSSISLYQGELLPGFYDDWVVFERERIQNLFESKMERLVNMLVEAERWTGVQEQSERWLALGNAPEPAYRALMLSHSGRGDMAKVSAVYQRCVEELRDRFGVEPSTETHALFNGLLKGARAPKRIVPAQRSGTVTFLFTDIQESTRLLDTLGEQYATLLAEHHKILRDAIQKWHGSEMDTQGDAFFVTFARALDAVQCAAEAQRELASHSWPMDEPIHVRMGLHTGEPLIASTGYVGMDVHRAARIGDAGHGGQVLLSQTTRDLILQDLPAGLMIRDLGEHRLKDMKYPTPIYQLVMEGLQPSFPPLKTKFTGMEAPTPGEPPFKGLQYFEEADSDLFFGRELLTAKLVNHIHETQFLSVVIGASGSGKSSLVRAGLVPALKQGKMLIGNAKPPEGSSDWQIHILTPTAHPLRALATELTRDSESVTATATLLDDFTNEPRSLSLFLQRKSPTAHTLLVVDQFEELFTLCRDEFEREAFIDNLLSAIAPDGGRITLVITLRADFYAYLAQYPELRDAVAKQQEYIGPMSTEELRSAIEEPAKRGHWEFEPGLVDLILRDVGDEPGALPLLSHALLETWKRRAGHTLTLKGYADAGGVHGAIAHTAESVYQTLSPEEQTIVHDIFLRLTELGEGTEDTRRRASFAELMSSQENAEEVHAVLNILADARLITLGEETAEVAHEALIREWPTLREWLNQDREGLRLHRHLTEAAHDWELLGRDPGALYRGAHLAQAREWAILHPKALNAGERSFLEASLGQEKHEEQEREEQRQRELKAAQKLAETQRARAEEQAHSANRLRIRNRVITTVGSIALILALLAGMFGVRSNQNEARAEANFNRAEAQRLALEANRLLSSGGISEQIALLSLRSMKTQYTPEGDAALVAAAGLDYPQQLYPQSSKAWTVDFSPDGSTMLTGNNDGIVRQWDVLSGAEVRQFIGHTKAVVSVKYSPDGKYVLTGSLDGTARIWETTTALEVQQFVNPIKSDGVAADYSPDGTYVLTNASKIMRLWDVETGQELRQFPGIFVPMFSPDGRYALAANPDFSVRLWDIESGQEIRQFIGHTNFVDSVAFSSDGKYILTGSWDTTARLWNAETGEEQSVFSHIGIVRHVAFSLDGKSIFTAADDDKTREWDIQTGEELRHFICSGETHFDISPDGKYLLVGGCNDGMSRLWNLKPQLRLQKFENDAIINAVAFSPDGKLVLTGDGEGIARLWDTTTGRKVREFIGHTNVINYGAVFSPDGKYVLTSSWDDTIRLWDIQTGGEVWQIVTNLDGPNDVTYSPEGNYIVAGGNGARLWDAATGKELHQYGIDDGTFVFSRVSFSPDGKYLVTSNEPKGTAQLWNVSTEQLLLEFTDVKGRMNSAAFSPDGKHVLTGGSDGIARLWDVKTGKIIRQFVGHSKFIYTAAFSPDGKYIATTSGDTTVRLWDTETGVALRRFSGHTAAVENVAFSPDGKYIVTGSDDGTAMLWDVDYHPTMQYLCKILLRDFTDDERTQYNIKDDTPTCPAK